LPAHAGAVPDCLQINRGYLVRQASAKKLNQAFDWMIDIVMRLHFMDRRPESICSRAQFSS